MTFRRPTQARGIAKFEQVLDATHRLIESLGVDGFSLYDVAEDAGVAVGSVYHFFPNLEATFIALVERYDAALAQVSAEPIDASRVTGWQDILAIQTERSRTFLNHNPAALDLLLGPGRSWQSRMADVAGNERIAERLVESCRLFYRLPGKPEPTELFLRAIAILEALWGLSYQRHGHVTDELARETRAAMTAYLRCYMPEHIEPNPS